jgi:hypothetical protein
MRHRKISAADIKRLQAGEPIIPLEDDVQTAIVKMLVFSGYRVLVTSRRAKKCPYCNKFSHKGDGASKGLGDLLVRHPSWPKNIWMMMEVKRPGPIAWSCKEQELFALAGDLIVVQSVEEALAAAREYNLERHGS